MVLSLLAYGQATSTSVVMNKVVLVFIALATICFFNHMLFQKSAVSYMIRNK